MTLYFIVTVTVTFILVTNESIYLCLRHLMFQQHDFQDYLCFGHNSYKVLRTVSTTVISFMIKVK